MTYNDFQLLCSKLLIIVYFFIKYVYYIIFKVFVHLRGTLGKVTKQHLMKEQNEDEMETDEPFTFKRATSERFVISGTDIGELISLEIEVSFCSFLF